jgi:hypothetical protein
MVPRKEPVRPALPQDDEVTEAGVESFPASDPPAYNMPGRAKQHERALQGRAAEGAPGAARGRQGTRDAAEGAVATEVAPNRDGEDGRRHRDPEAADRAAAPATRRAAARDAADPLSAIEQGMGRQNVRIGSGHVPTAAETDPQAHGPGRAALLVAAVLLAALVIWIVLI